MANNSLGFCGIILDLDMPIMGGLEACERIVKSYDEFQNISTGQHIPILSKKKNSKTDESEFSRKVNSISPQCIERSKKKLNVDAVRNAFSLKIRAAKRSSVINRLSVESSDISESNMDSRMLDESYNNQLQMILEQDQSSKEGSRIRDPKEPSSGRLDNGSANRLSESFQLSKRQSKISATSL